MEDNTQVVATEEVVTKTPFSAKAKEWFRKKIVNLKRRPNNIPLVFYAVTSVLYMVWLGTYSSTFDPDKEAAGMNWIGLLLFVNVLLSLLVLVSFIYAFPKRSKPKKMFLILTAVMTIVMIVCDVLQLVIIDNYIGELATVSVFLEDGVTVDYTYIDAAERVNMAAKFSSTNTITIVHIVLLAVSGVVFALLPVYSRLIKKINTSVKVESATENISSGAIDIQED